MRTLLRLVFCFTVFVSVSLQTAHAGVGTSGGGHVVLCDNLNSHTFGYTTLLDIYEAKYVFHLDLRAHRTSLDAELQLLAQQLQTVLGPKKSLPHPLTADTLLEWWENRVQFVPNMLAHTSDLGVVPTLPKGCAVKQVAIFDDVRQIIQVNSDLWESLDDFNKAALIAHEIVYHERRLNDFESSSQMSRFIVGRMFSTEALKDSNTMINEFRAQHPGGFKDRE